MTAVPINREIYEYTGPYYPAFKSGTTEKECFQMAIGETGKLLHRVGLVFNGTGRIRVADIACGPATTPVMCLQAIKEALSFLGIMPAFELYVTDKNIDYTGPGGEASKTLEQAQREEIIQRFFMTTGDAFGEFGKLFEVPFHSFNLVFVGHALYHAINDQQVKTFLTGLTRDGLAPGGVAILSHLEKRPGSFQYFRAKYGQAEGTDTPALIGNPPGLVEEICASEKLVCQTVRYTNPYFFEPMQEANWELFANPSRYEEIVEPAAWTNLYKLFFIALRGAIPFANDRNKSTGLSAFIQEARAIIAPNQREFERLGGLMPLAEAIQFIAGPGGDAQVQLTRVKEALDQKMPEFDRQALRMWVDKNQSKPWVQQRYL